MTDVFIALDFVGVLDEDKFSLFSIIMYNSSIHVEVLKQLRSRLIYLALVTSSGLTEPEFDPIWESSEPFLRLAAASRPNSSTKRAGPPGSWLLGRIGRGGGGWAWAGGTFCFFLWLRTATAAKLMLAATMIYFLWARGLPDLQRREQEGGHCWVATASRRPEYPRLILIRLNSIIIMANIGMQVTGINQLRLHVNWLNWPNWNKLQAITYTLIEPVVEKK